MNCLEITESITHQVKHAKQAKHVESVSIIESLPPIPRRIFLDSEEHEALICPSLKEIYDAIFQSK